MSETEKIIRFHIKNYPMMQPTDVVKLAFQSEFGGGHLIKDPEMSLMWIKKEIESLDASQLQEEPLLISIGNGIVRVNLAKLAENGITPEALNDCFVESAKKVKGSVDGLIAKLSVVTSMAKAGEFSFTYEEYMKYLEEYAASGYPMVSHSELYRNLYKPAYRVVKLEASSEKEFVKKIKR